MSTAEEASVAESSVSYSTLEYEDAILNIVNSERDLPVFEDEEAHGQNDDTHHLTGATSEFSEDDKAKHRMVMAVTSSRDMVYRARASKLAARRSNSSRRSIDQGDSPPEGARNEESMRLSSRPLQSSRVAREKEPLRLSDVNERHDVEHGAFRVSYQPTEADLLEVYSATMRAGSSPIHGKIPEVVDDDSRVPLDNVEAQVVDDVMLQDELRHAIMQEAALATVVKSEQGCISRKVACCIIIAGLVFIGVLVGGVMALQARASSASPIPESNDNATRAQTAFDYQTAFPTKTPTTEAPTKTPLLPPEAVELLNWLKKESFDDGNSLNDTNSPQYKAFEWLWQDELNSVLPSYTRGKQLARFALATLFFATDGSEWNNNEGWLLHDVDECDWDHLACSRSDVTSIDMRENRLVGTVPMEVAHLRISLTQLLLGHNSLSGSLASEIGLMGLLRRLHLTNNVLTGLPSELSLLSQLTSLDVAGNMINQLPSEVGLLGNLIELHLDNNPFGSSLLPSEIGGLSNLETLSARRCGLRGPLFTEIGRLVSLESLSLRHNQLTGDIPTEIAGLKALQTLDLGLNSLSGIVPSELGAITRLTSLVLASNNLTDQLPLEIFTELSSLSNVRLNGNKMLSGSLPSEIGLWTAVETLSMEGNELSGQVPPTIGSMSSLVTLRLSNNSFTGTIPSEIGLLSNLTELDISRTAIGGRLPDELGNLVKLRKLKLVKNVGNVRGRIPSSYRRLTALTHLELDQMSGTIPSNLLDFDSLQHLVISNGRLRGAIPSEISQLSSLLYLDLSNNRLNSTVPIELSTQLPMLKELYLQGNRLTGDVPSMDQSPLLETAHFAFNRFKGSVPSALCGLASLESLSTDCSVACPCCEFCCSVRNNGVDANVNGALERQCVPRDFRG